MTKVELIPGTVDRSGQIILRGGGRPVLCRKLAASLAPPPLDASSILLHPHRDSQKRL